MADALVPLAVRVANRFRDDLETLERAQATVMAREWLSVEQALRRVIDALVEEAYGQLTTGEEPKAWQIFRLTRYAVLRVQALREIDRYIETISPPLNGNWRNMARKGARDAVTLVRAVGMEYGQTIRVTLMDLSAAAVENIVALARAGEPLHELMLLRGYGEAVDGLLRELIDGIALGRHPREAARQMRDVGLGRGYAHLELVARDQHNRAYRLASHQQYQRSGVVKGYRRLAAKNERTCLACLALDGEVYETDELMELHPQDRCTMVPLVQGLPPVRFRTGREWFERLDYGQQRALMGPRRHDAWLEGRFDFRDLATRKENATWGPSVAVTTLEALGI